MAESTAACPLSSLPSSPVPTAIGLQLFQNDDGCGDWVVPLGQGARMQPANAVSAAFFVVAGFHNLITADTPIARTYGFVMCIVGFCSCSFHCTSSVAGFFIDIAPMAFMAGIMLYKGVHALQAKAGSRGSSAETARLCIPIAAAAFAVYMPWLLMQIGVSHPVVWGVWAFLFGSMGVVFALIALAIFYDEGVLIGKPGRDIVVGIVFILLGLGCTLHSFIPGLCEGWRTAVPLHAGWHFFSSVTSNRAGLTLDSLAQLVERMEDSNRPKEKRASLLLRMTKDFLPSQFSM